jgi:hypothetical protein
MHHKVTAVVVRVQNRETRSIGYVRNSSLNL